MPASDRKTLQILTYSITSKLPEIKNQRLQAKSKQKFLSFILADNAPSYYSIQNAPGWIKINKKNWDALWSPNRRSNTFITLSASNSSGTQSKEDPLLILPHNTP